VGRENEENESRQRIGRPHRGDYDGRERVAEQLWALRQAFEDETEEPCEASVIGEPVQVLKFDFDGSDRRD